MNNYILAINDGIGSSAGIFKNGRALFCCEEERFNRIKNWLGYPENVISYILNNLDIKISEIDMVVLTNERVMSEHSKESFNKYYDDNFDEAVKTLKHGYHRTNKKIKSSIKNSPLGFVNNMRLKYSKTSPNCLSTEKLISLGFDESKINRTNHHLCHASAAYYGLAQKIDEKYLIFSLDGGGDGYTSTLFKAQNGKIELFSGASSFSIGNMYSGITYFLGFRPHEHEYKLMGLAPYVNPIYSEEYCAYFRQFLDLKNDDTEFYNPVPLDHSSFFSKLLTDLNKDRFDNIAAGLQKFTEEICLRWVKGNIKKHGVNKILLSGGVFMNVKMNKLIAELPEVNFVDVFPSCGDESNIFGAAYYNYNQNVKKEIGLLNSYCLGTEPSGDLESSMLKYKEKIIVETSSSVNKKIAELIASNNIVARCSGKMEFGARALGNRSIMANPARLQNITKINQAVKKRDFWMPFAPAILIDKCESYVKIPNSIKDHGSPYMMFAVDTVNDDSKRQEITCGIHQSDFTARIEGVHNNIYPDFYEIINEFYNITGTPCVLNTSFNLHGFPIVENSEQAIQVLLNSKIDYLIIDNKIISRK